MSSKAINKLKASIESLEAMILMSASVNGTDASNWLTATASDDVVSAGAGDDEIHAPFGANYVDGGRGIDTFVIYEGARSDFDVAIQADGSVLVQGNGLNGVETTSRLINVERISFTDQILETAGLPIADNGGSTDDSVTPALIEPTAVLDPVVEPPAEPQTLMARNDTIITGDNVLTTGNVLLNDIDPSGDKLTIAVTKQPSTGLLLIASDGRFAFLQTTPHRNLDHFEYSITNDRGEVSTARVDILKFAPNPPAVEVPATTSPFEPPLIEPPLIEPPSIDTPETAVLPSDVANLNPQAVDDLFASKAGEVLFGNVSANDSDSDGPDYSLEFRLVEDVELGSLNFYSDGSFDYSVDGFTGIQQTFRYEVRDRDGGVSYAVATIDLPSSTTPPGPPQPVTPLLPVVIPTTVIAAGGSESANDLVYSTRDGDVEGDLISSGGSGLQVVEHTAAQFGEVSVKDDGRFAYTADAGFNGIDYFHYLVEGIDQQDWATVVIHANADGDVPDGINDFIAVTPGAVTPIVFDLNQDGVINVTGQTTAKDKSSITAVGETVQFDIDADGTLESIEWIDGTGDGILVDTSKFQGTDIDGSALFGDEGGQYENGFVKLAALDSDGNSFLERGELSSLNLWVDNGDGILQASELDSLQQHEIFSVSTRMTVTDAGLMQASAFTYAETRILTEDVWFAESDVESPTVPDEENVAPNANPDVLTGKRNELIVGNLLSNDLDPDGDALTIQKHTRPVHGLVTIDNVGAFTYTPDKDFVGVDYFQYQVSDANGGTDTAVVMLNVLSDTAVVAQQTGNAINGTIWADTNRNGLQDATESERGSSVFVSLLSAQGTVLQSVNTNIAGEYSFGNLQDGSYRIRVSASSLPAIDGDNSVLALRDVNSNFFDAVDSDVSSSSGLSSLISLDRGAEGTQTVTIDAGYIYAR